MKTATDARIRALMELVGRLRSDDLTNSHEGGGGSGSDISLGSFSLELASSLGMGTSGAFEAV
jgi:hypothetical protein